MIIKTFSFAHICFAIKKFSEFIMPLDINKYRKYVDGFDLEEEQKVELLQTIWSTMESFVDTAFELHPVQQCQNHLPEKDLQSPKRTVKSDLIPTPNNFKNEVEKPRID